MEKKRSISTLGYATESVAPKHLLHDVQLASMPRSLQFKLLMKRAWLLLVAIPVMFLVIFPAALVGVARLKSNPLIDLSAALIIGGFLFVLFMAFFMVTIGRTYVPKRAESLQCIEKTYKAFIRDLVVIGSYNILDREEEFLSMTQNWIEQNDEGKAFIKKLIEVRNIPAVEKNYFNTGDSRKTYREYIETYRWFQWMSSFVPKLII